MKSFLAIYIGTQAARAQSGWDGLSADQRTAREAAGIKAWMEWGERNAAAIVEQGGPLGKTKRAAPGGVIDITNSMVGYVVVRAESHEAAAALFAGHPHFTIFPGESVEIMECLPLPGR